MDGEARPARRQGCFAVRIVKPVVLALTLCATVACASPGVPPGGPEDKEAPQIVRIAPDSGKTGVSPREAIFRFDEVVSERPSGVASLGALFVISPRDGEPRVSWHREEISVRPRRAWRKNTAYTITLLPGLADLRGNIRNTAAVTMFSTGATIPTSRIGGTLFNWPEGRIVTRGLVEARPRADTTLAYVAATDSAGSFLFPNLPAGSYVVRGISDDNANHGLDPREAWDTAMVNLTDSARVDLFGFVHDSIGSRLASVLMKDSVTLVLTFDNPLAVTPPLGPANIRVRAPDSTDVPVVSVMPPPPDTTISKTPRPSRPIPPRVLTVRLGRPLRARTDYRVSVTDARNLTGVARTSDRILSVPAAPAAAATPPPAAPPPAAPPAAAPIRR